VPNGRERTSWESGAEPFALIGVLGSPANGSGKEHFEETSMDKELETYLKPGKYVDSNSPVVVEKAKAITKGLSSDAEKVSKIFAYVRDLPFDIVGGFTMLLAGKDKASDCLKEGRGFCMHKATAFAALCRASNIPARIAFQIVECLDKPFFPQKIRHAYGQRPQPWHSGAEVYVNGKWLMADCTVDKDQGTKCGRTVADFDGTNDVFTVEGPILKERGTSPDVPEAVVDRHRKTADSFLKALESENPTMTPAHVLEGQTAGLQLTPSVRADPWIIVKAKSM
jgi:transglutaminase-like putative cysteine protease